MKYPWVGLHKDDGHFIVSAELKDAAIDYVPSMKVLDDGNFERAAHWPLLTDIQGRLIFEGASMTVLADTAKTRREGFKNPRRHSKPRSRRRYATDHQR